jgi:beta-glucanase (GH16 family)
MKIENTHMKTIKQFILKSVVIILFFTLSSCSNDETQDVVNNFTTLVRVDDFNTDDELDDLFWNYDIGTGPNNDGWGNNELQYYTDRSENVSVQNGLLIITAREESLNGSGYTSGRIITKDLIEQQYGRFEARIKLPYGQGIWPAFWMLGSDCDEVVWPQCGEIDIMEYRGQEPTKILGSVHGPGYSGGQAITKSYSLENDRFDTGFHVFGIEWTPNYINYYVDDVLYNQITREDVPGEWVFDKPFYMLINLAVGGSFVGSPNSETTFPQNMLVDYVRVYKK